MRGARWSKEKVAEWASIVARWRDGYHSMSFLEHQALYSEFYSSGLPEQAHFDLEAARAAWPWGGTNVCEIGGWDGQLAQALLSENQITRWVNYEVCLEAAGSLKTDRYEVVTDRWVWDDDLGELDTLVASHSLEHMSLGHLRELLGATGHMERGFVQVPNDMGPCQTATHILGLTVDALAGELTEHGWCIRDRFPGKGVVGDDTVLIITRE